MGIGTHAIVLCVIAVLACCVLCAEYATYKLPLDMPQAWSIGACIGILISAIFSFFILPSLLFAGLLCTGAAGA